MIPAARVLELPMEELARDVVRRVYGWGEELGVYGWRAELAANDGKIPKTLARALQRLTLEMANQIDRLPDEASREAGKAFEVLRARMRAAVAAVDEKPSERDIVRVANAWQAELRSFVDNLAERHRPLERKYAKLGQQMADLPLEVLGLEVAPPAAWKGTDARGYYLGLEDRYGPDASRIKRVLDRVRNEQGDVADARVKIARIIDLPEHRAALIMRQEIGRINQQVSYDRTQEVGQEVSGLQAEWLSILDPKRSRSGHMEAHGLIVENDQPFLVRPDRGRPYERLRFPKDPSGSMANVANCLCLRAPRVDRAVVSPRLVA